MRRASLALLLPATLLWWPACTCAIGPSLFDAGHGTLWISSLASGNVYVLDAADGGMVGQISLPGDGGRGASVAARKDGTKVYVANEGADAVHVIDARTLSVEATFAAARPRDLRLSPDERKLYIAQASGNEILEVDLAALTVRSIPAGGTSVSSRPQSLWVTPAGEVYVVNQLSNRLALLNLDAGAAAWLLPIPSTPTRFVATRAGNVGYVTGSLGDVVQRIHLKPPQGPDAGAMAPVGSEPGWISISADDRWLVVSNGATDTGVSVFDLSLPALIELGRITVGTGGIQQSDLSADGKLAYVTVQLPPQVTVADVQQRQVVTVYGLPEAPRGIAVAPRVPAQ